MFPQPWPGTVLGFKREAKSRIADSVLMELHSKSKSKQDIRKAISNILKFLTREKSFVF